MATPEILSMSPTQIEEKEEEPEIFESTKETNLPLLPDSGATAYVQLESGGPTTNKSQGNRITVITVANNNEIMITEFKNKCIRLLSIGSFQQVHPANLLTRRVINNSRPTKTYTRATNHVQSKQRSEEHCT